MKNFGLGLVGATLQGGYFLAPAIVDSVEHTGLRLRAVRETNHEAAREVERNTVYGYSTHDIQQELYLTRELSHLLADSMLDGMLITAPAAHHRHLLESALDSRKKVALQNPLASTLEDARAITEACREQTVLVNLPRRFDAGWQKTYELLQSGIIGRLQFINLRAYLPETNYLRLWERTQEGSDDLFMAQLSSYMDVFNWFANAACLHVAGIGDEGEYDLDTVDPKAAFHDIYRQLPLRWRVKVSPHTAGSVVDDFPTDHYLDHAAIQLLFGNNVIGTLNFTSSGATAQDTEELELVGEKGRMWFNPLTGTLQVQCWDNSPLETITNLGPAGLPLYQRYNQAFVAALPDFLEGAEPKVTMEDALDALEMTFAALHSIHNNGMPVMLDLALEAQPLPLVESAAPLLEEEILPVDEVLPAATEEELDHDFFEQLEALSEDSVDAVSIEEVFTQDSSEEAPVEFAQVEIFEEELSEADMFEIDQQNDSFFETLLQDTEETAVEDAPFIDTVDEELAAVEESFFAVESTQEIADPSTAPTQQYALPEVEQQDESEAVETIQPAVEPEYNFPVVLIEDAAAEEPEIFADLFTPAVPQHRIDEIPNESVDFTLDEALDAVPQVEFAAVDDWEDDHPAVEDITDTAFSEPETVEEDEPQAVVEETAPQPMTDWTEEDEDEEILTDVLEETPVRQQPPMRSVDWPDWLETGIHMEVPPVVAAEQPAVRPAVEWPAWLDTGIRAEQPRPVVDEMPADTTAQWPTWMEIEIDAPAEPYDEDLLESTEEPVYEPLEDLLTEEEAPEIDTAAFIEPETEPLANTVNDQPSAAAEDFIEEAPSIPQETMFAEIIEEETVLEILEITDFIITDDETEETLETMIVDEGKRRSPKDSSEDAVVESPSVVISEKIHLDDFIWDIVPLQPFRLNADPRTGDAWEEPQTPAEPDEEVTGETLAEPLADAPFDSVDTFHNTTTTKHAYYEADTRAIDYPD